MTTHRSAKTRRSHLRPAYLGALACGILASSATADVIVEDAFNYIQPGLGLASFQGGAGTAGWANAWSADPGDTVGAGLTYTPVGNAFPTIGLGNGASLTSGAGISRNINPYTTGSTLWMRMLYTPGSVTAPGTPAYPFSLSGADGGLINVTRAVDLAYSANAFSLTMDGTVIDPLQTPATQNFSLADDAGHVSMLLWKLSIDQTPSANETLQMWIDPTAGTEGTLPGADVTLSQNVLEGGAQPDDYLGFFVGQEFGGTIDELLIGSTFADAISLSSDPLTTVPEPSTLIMSMVTLLGAGIGFIRYRRNNKAKA